MLVLYGSNRSRANRCLWLIEELGLPYRREPYDPRSEETRSPAFRALNPSGKVPVLRDGDVVLSESHAINLWLAQRAGGPLWPADPHIQGKVLQWILWTATELEPLTGGIPKAKMAGGPDMDKKIAELREAACGQIALVEAHLAARDFLVGDSFTLADLNLASLLCFVKAFGIDLGPYPRTSAWLAAALRRPAYQRLFAT